MMKLCVDAYLVTRIASLLQRGKPLLQMPG
jgi:hypothetical protein